MVVLGSAVHAQESAGDAADAARKASLRAAQYVTAEDCARLDVPKLRDFIENDRKAKKGK